MVLLIMFCALIGTVILIGVCSPLSAAITRTPRPKDTPPSIISEEPVRDDWDANANCEYSVPGESTGDAPIKADLREWIASSSVQVLRLRGMSDEEIKFELLRDFALTEEQVDGILAHSKDPKP